MYRSDVASSFGGKISCTQFIITYQDLAAITGSGAQSINFTDADNNAFIFLLPPAPGVAYVGSAAGLGKLIGIEVKEQTTFVGTGISALTISVGRSGSNTLFTSAYPLMQTVADTTLQETSLFKAGGRTQFAPTVTFTPTGGNLSAMTAGSVTVTLLYWNTSTPVLAG
jgi:hypothetical protein